MGVKAYLEWKGVVKPRHHQKRLKSNFERISSEHCADYDIATSILIEVYKNCSCKR